MKPMCQVTGKIPGKNSGLAGCAVCLALVLQLSAASLQAAGSGQFATPFDSHMVLQRDQPLRLWGNAEPGMWVRVELAGQSAETQSDHAGTWKVELPPMSAGGPFDVLLRSGDQELQRLEDVLLGDVWLCSGQSNMEFPVSRGNGYNPAQQSHHAGIRLLSIDQDSQVRPRTDYRMDPTWKVAGPETIGEFSAVCFYFARALQTSDAVPLGLIDASWGGSRIEAWVSSKGLRPVPGYADPLDLLQSFADNESIASQEFGRQWEEWWNLQSPSMPAPWLSTAANSSGWKAAPGVLVDWKTFGDPELAEHHGMVWYEIDFELTAGQALQDATLKLGRADEVDVTWINGHFIGSQFGWGTERSYQVPAAVLRPGQNTLTVNVLNTWGAGGLLGPDQQLLLAKGESVSLANGWQYRKVPAELPSPPRAPWEPIAGLTGLFNGMIAPLAGLGVKGAMWYQGESNAGSADNYQALLGALARGWRSHFAADLPFLVIQLPNFGAVPNAPVESGWAEVRQAQQQFAISDPAAGLVPTIDLGENRELHPQGKEFVGLRAANVARALVYGGEGVVDGLLPVRTFRQGDEIVVEFDPALDTLQVLGDDRPVAFELCGATAGSCHYASARLQDNRVRLAADGVAAAIRVRHCWSDGTICNLYGKSGLPVSSFEVAITPE